MTTARVELPPKLIPILSPPLGTFRYRVLRGGRGSGKSFNVAKMSAIWGIIEPIRILCTREFQNSIKNSFYAEIVNAIKSESWLESQYEIGRDFIRHKTNGTEYLFAGLRHNIDSIKSIAQIKLCIIEEAETVPPQSWQALTPTIRAPGSEIIVIYNPRDRNSWASQNFDGENTPPRSAVVDINYCDNPWFPRELDEQRLHDREVMDPALYSHIWEGAFYEKSDAQVFNGKYRVVEFEPGYVWDGPYFGVDFGFSNSPTAGVKAWVHEDRLYIEYDLSQVGLELDNTAPALIAALPGIEDHASRGDCARPESISYLQRHGLKRMTACKKGKGSVEDGIQFIRSFKEVVIHPRCKDAIDEFRLYSYKVDRLSGDILDVPVDANNHVIDSIRYALEPIMKASRAPRFVAGRRK